MISIIVFTICFVCILRKANNDFGKVEGFLYKAHVCIAWFLLLSCANAPAKIIWAVSNTDKFLGVFYVSHGPIPDWLSLMTCGVNYLFSLVALVIVFLICHRNDRGRLWLCRIIPILCVSSVLGSLLYASEYIKNTNSHLGMAVTICILFWSIPFAILFVFYRHEKVREHIFNNTKKSF